MKLKITAGLILILGAIYLLGPQPETPVFSNVFPEMPLKPRMLEKAVADFEDRADIKPDNEARIEWANDSLKEKTEYVLLYLHGYTASRMEGEPVYSDFAKEYGMNVYAARLATQGLDTVDQMVEYYPERVWASAKRALAIAGRLGDRVIIMSTSTGGTLALMLAATFPDKVHALINMSPNIRINDPTAYLLNDPWGLQIARTVLGGKFRHLKNRDSTYEKYWYTTYRIESLVYLQDLLETAMTEETFAKVTCPVLNLYYYRDQAHQDPVVRVDKILWMHDHLGTPTHLKRAVAIPGAETHVIGNGFYSKAVVGVEEACFSFGSEILNLQP